MCSNLCRSKTYGDSRVTRCATIMRTTVVHLHLFKNAGTSVERGLQSYFGEHWVSFDKPSSGGRISQAELVEFLHARPFVQAVSSHHLRPPLEDRATMNWLPILFLRHPIDRIRSAYEFERRQGSITPSSKAAASMQLVEWVQFHRERPSSTQCRNFQTFGLTSIRRETGRPIFRRPMKSHFDSACAFVKRLPAFGLVESFDQSWDWISDWISGSYPNFKPDMGRANATTDASDVLGERLERMRAEMGQAAFDQLLVDNEVDLALYSWARERAHAAWA